MSDYHSTETTYDKQLVCRYSMSFHQRVMVDQLTAPERQIESRCQFEAYDFSSFSSFPTQHGFISFSVFPPTQEAAFRDGKMPNTYSLQGYSLTGLAIFQSHRDIEASTFKISSSIPRFLKI